MKFKPDSPLEEALSLLETLDSEQINTINNSVAIHETLETIADQNHYMFYFYNVPSIRFSTKTITASEEQELI